MRAKIRTHQCDQIIIIFFCLFQTFCFDGFFLLMNCLSNKSANIMSTVGVRMTLVQGNLKKNICYFKAQRDNKG